MPTVILGAVTILSDVELSERLASAPDRLGAEMDRQS